ncbi:hypothetical protein [Bacillus atrophaeus]|uniref:hypothetical protein n=1 Tax=Bacillus atrophaeus TaxID=1452 RepID=UPI000B1D5412|nr:hypothetical protein [Bacillus atrophaeus]
MKSNKEESRLPKSKPAFFAVNIQLNRASGAEESGQDVGNTTQNSPCLTILIKKQQNIERNAEELYTELKNMSDVERENAIAEIKVVYL